MALTYDVTKVEDWERKWDDLHLEHNLFPFLTFLMVTGTNRITEEGLPELEERLSLYVAATGAGEYDRMGEDDRLEWMVTLARNLVGITTNVSPKTRAAYKRDLMGILGQEADRMLRGVRAVISGKEQLEQEEDSNA